MKRVTVAGHSLHPMLVVFPLGLLPTSLVWDIIYLATNDPTWAVVSFWTIVPGVVGGLLAAVPGLLDWMAIPEKTRAKRIGAWHGSLNVAILGLFGASIAARAVGGYAIATLEDMVPGWIGIGLAMVSAWLGGELVERLGVGVDNFQDVNASSSLRSRRPRGSTVG